MKKRTLTIALTAAALSCFSQDINRLIQQKEVEQTVKILSSDDMQGRGNFTPGIEKAARVIEGNFKSIGLQPLPGNSDYRQTFSMTKSVPSKVSVTLNGDHVPDENWLITSAGTFNWSKDSSVRIIKIGPGKSFPEEYLSIIRNNQNALVLVDKQYEAIFRHIQHNLGQASVSFKKPKPSAQVFILGGYETLKSFSVSYHAQSEELSLANIAGMIPGKTKPGEYVIFSAHYDNLGIIKAVGQDSIANGADNDASGIAGVIALAKYYSRRANGRSIIFVAFTAEKIGDYGSEYFATRINADKVVAMFNFVMLGLTSSFGEHAAFITGFDRSDLGAILERNSAAANFKFYPDPYPKFDLFYRSDNASLARLGVPAHTISTEPVDADKYYNTVMDELKTLNIPNLTATIRAMAVCTGSIINGKDTPVRVKQL